VNAGPWLGPALAAASIAAFMGSAAAVTGHGLLAAMITPRPARSWTLERISPTAKRRLGGAVGLAVGLGLPFPFPRIVLWPLLWVAGQGTPALLERRARQRHRAAIDAQIPQLLDLLAAASSAGLSGRLALRRAVEALGGPLAAELEGALDAVELGAPWRAELAATADRLGLPDLRRTVAALNRTETLGASLSGSTADLATSVRAARRSAVTERARTAPVKMLFPLVFLVLPAFLLLTVVPVLITTVQSIR
jgi:tight adherence protein C